MKTLVTSIVLALSLTLTHAKETPDYLEYQCVIPKGMPNTIELHGKDDKKEVRDMHEIYREYHAIGWHLLMHHYMEHGHTDCKPDEEQEFGVMSSARLIGMAEATASLIKLELTGSDKSEIQKMLKTHYRKAESEQAGADQPTTAPELKSEGKDKPQPESKIAPR